MDDDRPVYLFLIVNYMYNFLYKKNCLYLFVSVKLETLIYTSNCTYISTKILAKIQIGLESLKLRG